MSATQKSRPVGKSILGAVILAALVYAQQQGWIPVSTSTGGTAQADAEQGFSQPASPSANPDTSKSSRHSVQAPDGNSSDSFSSGAKKIVDAFEAHRSDVIVTTNGKVRAVLPDDNDGARHQRFILEIAGGHTVLVAHNIDLAPRLPDLQRGDTVTVKGEYEYSEKGGVIHWTHHDPAQRHPGGWLELDGKRYE